MPSALEDFEVSQTYIDGCAGMGGAVFKIVAGYPFETLKVTIQSSSSHNSSLVPAIRKLIHAGGLNALYRGVTPSIPTLLLYNSVLFSTFGTAVDMLNKDSSSPFHYRNIAMAGALAGAAATAIIAPMELARVRIQSGINYNSLTDCFKHILKTGPYRGASLMLVREIIGNILYFVVYEATIRELSGQSMGTNHMHKGVNLATLSFAGGLAGVANWAVIYPIDTAKTLYQTGTPWRSIRARSTTRLYGGFQVCLLRGFVANGLTFLGVELTYRLATYFQ